MLATDGVVVIRQNKGATVAAYSPAEGKDILRMRIELEDIVVRSVAGRLSGNDIRELRQSIEMEHASVERDPAAYNAHASAFHRRLAEMAGSDILKEYLTNLLTKSSLVFYTYGRPRWTRCNSDEHASLLDALESGEVETARLIMRSHLESLYNRAFSDEKLDDGPSLEDTLKRYLKRP
jgi:DNA-binding GntR family transcriptional regulator